MRSSLIYGQQRKLSAEELAELVKIRDNIAMHQRAWSNQSTNLVTAEAVKSATITNVVSVKRTVDLTNSVQISSLKNVVPESQKPPLNPSQSRLINNDTYIIAPHDKLGFKIQEDRKEQKSLTVPPSGEIVLPEIGHIMVAGKTLTQAARDIKTLYEKDYYRVATVYLTLEQSAAAIASLTSTSNPNNSSYEMVAPPQIIIIGQVRITGIQELPTNRKFMLSRAIVRAGGFGSFANSKKTRVVRRSKYGLVKVIEVDMHSVLIEGKLDNDIELLPEDLIIVPEKLINF
jgi:polysaccharide biosynthesis/export protein